MAGVETDEITKPATVYERGGQRAAQQLLFHCNKLHFSDLTSNPVLLESMIRLATVFLLRRSGVQISPGVPFFKLQRLGQYQIVGYTIRGGNHGSAKYSSK
jgi:hypothetical protein